MVAIPFPLSTFPGQRPQEGAGRLVNCYAEAMGENARGKAVQRRAPGLTAFGTSTHTGFRGMQLLAGTLFAGYDGQVVSFTSAGGAATPVGSLAGTGKLTWARNNNAVPQLVAVDPDNGGFVVTSGSVVAYPDPDLGQPNAVAFQNGFFFFTFGNSMVRSSGINTTAIDSNHFITAESKVDGLLRPIPWNGQMLFLGNFSCEVWDGSAVNTTGFPYNKVTAIQRGLLGRHAIAGHEDGFGKALIWVADDGGVYMLNGYTPDKISPPDLDRLIERVADKNELEAAVYVSNGRAIWALSCSQWTWEFNINTLKWNERESYEIPRWRGTQAHFAFGKWLVGDTKSGNLLQIDAAAKKEVDEPLRARVESAPVHQFPNRIRVARADFDISAGVGIATGADPNETDPTMEISWSDDGGVNWSNPLLRKMGAQARASQRVTVLRTGMSGAQGRRWRVDCADPVDFALMGGDMGAELRNK